jgi:hypothetical protein
MESLPLTEWRRTLERPVPGLTAEQQARAQISAAQAISEAEWLSVRCERVDSSNVERDLEGTGIEFPQLVEALWQKYIAFLVGERFLPPAP